MSQKIDLLYSKNKFLARVTEGEKVLDYPARVSRQKGNKYVAIKSNERLTSYYNNGKQIRIKIKHEGKDKEIFIKKT